MALYTGIDLIEIARIAQAVERWGPRFLQRVFTARELADCQSSARAPKVNIASLAARWAAKEAASKALGVGLRGIGAQAVATQPPIDAPVGWQEIEVVRAANGRPLLHLHGAAAARATHLHLTELAVSLSHTHTHAIASVIGLAHAIDTQTAG